MTLGLTYPVANLMWLAHGLYLLHSVWILKGVSLITIKMYVWQYHLPCMSTWCIYTLHCRPCNTDRRHWSMHDYECMIAWYVHAEVCHDSHCWFYMPLQCKYVVLLEHRSTNRKNLEMQWHDPCKKTYTAPTQGAIVAYCSYVQSKHCWKYLPGKGINPGTHQSIVIVVKHSAQGLLLQ